MCKVSSLLGPQSNQLLSHFLSLEAYEKKKSDYLTDLEQFHDLIRQMDEHVATLTQKKKERAEELDETNRKLARATSSVESLKCTINCQEMSIEDVQKLQNEKKGVEEAIDRAVRLKEERLKASWETEAALEKLWTELEAAVSDYDAKLSELTSLPLVSAKGVPMKIVVDKHSALDNDETKLLGVDLTNTVHSVLHSCKHQLSENLSVAKWKYQEALDQLDKSEQALTEAMEKLKIVRDKAAKSDETLEKERESQEAKLAVRQREVDSMEAKVASLRDPVALEEQMARYERQCAELESLRLKYQEESVSRKNATCEEIEQKLEEMLEYEDNFERRVAEVKNYWSDAKATCGKLKLPPNTGEALETADV
jgi:chromosome segregation ATPase